MKTVIFDLDGTLVDTADNITASINHVRTKYYRIPPLTKKEIIRSMNTPGLNLAYEFYGVEYYDENAKIMFEEHYARQCIHNAKSFDGIYEMLSILKKDGFEMFVATNAPTKTSRIILKNNMIEPFFEDIIGADRVEHVKPHPQMIRKIIRGRPKEFCWMVGDSLKDIMAAKSAGITPIFAQWGFADSNLSIPNIEKKVKKPSDVLKIVHV